MQYRQRIATCVSPRISPIHTGADESRRVLASIINRLTWENIPEGKEHYKHLLYLCRNGLE